MKRTLAQLKERYENAMACPRNGQSNDPLAQENWQRERERRTKEYISALEQRVAEMETKIGSYA